MRYHSQVIIAQKKESTTMEKYYYYTILENDAIVFLGDSPQCNHAQDALYDATITGSDCACKLKFDVQCDVPHAYYNVGKNSNGFKPHYELWSVGDCGGAYTGWTGLSVYQVRAPHALAARALIGTVQEHRTAKIV